MIQDLSYYLESSASVILGMKEKKKNTYDTMCLPVHNGLVHSTKQLVGSLYQLVGSLCTSGFFCYCCY